MDITIPQKLEQEARQRIMILCGMVAALLVLFGGPLVDLVRLARRDDLYSHVFLVPFISLYLIRLHRDRLSVVYSSCLYGLLLFGAAGLFLATIPRGNMQNFDFTQTDLLTITTTSCLCCIMGAVLLVLGFDAWRVMLFPLLFLFFIVPMPEVVLRDFTHFFQHWSGLATDALLRLTGTPVCRDGMILHMPGLTLEVAEECSGIRSTLVLFMTGLLGAHLFLRKSWTRALLVVSVVPIGILRNATRIVTLALVTMHVDHNAINGPLHQEGGAPFFVLSLVPLFIILWLLRRAERVRPV